MLQTEPRPNSYPWEGRYAECTVCPPWVVRCAHWDGQIVLITDGDLVPDTGCGNDRIANANHSGYKVCVTEGAWSTCGDCGLLTMASDQQLSGTRAADLPAAEAEFRRREAALLGRAE